MNIIERLATSLGRRDEQPNIDLAIELSKSGDKKAISELVSLTKTGKKPIRYNAIKVLYELGELEPALLLPHAQNFVDLLADKDNRILWGTIQALDIITDCDPEFIAKNLNLILDAADRSSVIAKDKTMSILSTLNADKRLSTVISPTLLQRLEHAPTNQFPMYAEMAATTIPQNYRDQLIKIIENRRVTISFPAKQKRLDKLLSRISNT